MIARLYLFLNSSTPRTVPFETLAHHSPPLTCTSLFLLQTKINFLCMTIHSNTTTQCPSSIATKFLNFPDFTIMEGTKLQQKLEPINKSISILLLTSENSIPWKFLNCSFRNVINEIDIGKHMEAQSFN